jgi:lipopolysaccharide export system protein LptA
MNFTPRFTMIQLTTLLLSGIMLLFSTVNAAESPQVPIHIEADRMISQEQDNSVMFTGNVDARQGELLIRTDKMTVYYVQNENNNGKKGSSEVNKLICNGNVQNHLIPPTLVKIWQSISKRFFDEFPKNTE